jgi:hypothetical protein
VTSLVSFLDAYRRIAVGRWLLGMARQPRGALSTKEGRAGLPALTVAEPSSYDHEPRSGDRNIAPMPATHPEDFF